MEYRLVELMGWRQSIIVAMTPDTTMTFALL